jgi:diacylglycerol kinase (ATP)
MTAQTPRILAIVNPAAGGDTEGVVADLSAALGTAVDVVRTTGPGHAERIALEIALTESPDVVVAVGGDGTVREVASGLHQATGCDRNPALLVAPGGTGNSSYRGIWRDRPWAEVAAAVVSGTGAQTRRIDLAVVEELDRLVLLGAGAGLIAQGLITAEELGGTGRDRLLQATIATMAVFKPYPGRVTVDGEVLDEGDHLLVNVGGNRYRAGNFQLLPHSLLDDHLLDVCVVGGAADPAEVAGVAMTGTIDSHPEVRYARGARITVERTDGEPLVFEHDGDVMPLERTSYTVRVLPGALPMIVPRPAPECLHVD